MAARRYHGLIDSDLAALASGNFTAELVSRLQSAVFSRNALLTEDLRRGVRASQADEVSDVIESAVRVLAAVQAHSPGVVRKLLISPHFGLWVADALIRFRSESRPDGSPAVAPRELGHIASFAVAAGLMTSHHFQIQVPVQDGAIVIPLVGRVSVPCTADWAEIRLDEHGLRVLQDDDAGGRSLAAPRNLLSDRSAWTETHRLTSTSGGLSLDLTLEDSDPCLSRLSLMPTAVAEGERDEWQRCLSRAWQIIVHRHGEVACALAGSLSALVPLRAPENGGSVSAASGWAWGAIALSLPPDPVAFAETMIHEFRHLALGAAEDIYALTAGDGNSLYYSPWRDDPRPLSGLLQGCYAFCGVGAFWRRERHLGTASQRRRAELVFALRRNQVHRAIEVLASSELLTDTGKAIVDAIGAQVTGWRSDCVSEQAASRACEISALHEMRWRIANLVPDQDVVDDLARKWLSDRVVKPDHAYLRSAVVASPHQRLYDGSRLLEQALTDPDTVPQLWPRLTAGDRHLLQGHSRTAFDAYLHQLREGRDPNAWIGLTLSLRRIGFAEAGCARPEHAELLVAVAERVRATTGQLPSSAALLASTRTL
jgi:HEXXH motif-containing protein